MKLSVLAACGLLSLLQPALAGAAGVPDDAASVASQDISASAATLVEAIGRGAPDVRSRDPELWKNYWADAETIARAIRGGAIGDDDLSRVAKAALGLSRRGKRSDVLFDALNARLEMFAVGDRLAGVVFESLAAGVREAGAEGLASFGKPLAAMVAGVGPAAGRLDEVMRLAIEAQRTPRGLDFGDFHTAVRHAISEGRVEPELVRAYLDASLRPKLVLEPRQGYRPGDVVKVTMELDIPAAVLQSRVSMQVKLVGDAAGWEAVGEHLAPAVLRHFAIREWDFPSHLPPRLVWWMRVPEGVNGEYVVQAELDVRLYEWMERGPATAPWLNYADPARLGDLTAPKVRLLKCCVEHVTVMPGLGPTREVNLAKTPIPTCSVWKSASTDLMSVTVRADPDAPAWSCVVVVRQGEMEQEIGGVVVENGRGGVSGRVAGLRRGPCTVVLRPRPALRGLPTWMGGDVDVPAQVSSWASQDWDFPGAYRSAIFEPLNVPNQSRYK